MDLYLIFVGSVITIVLFVALLIRKHYSIWKDMGAPYEEPIFPYGNLKYVGKENHFGGILQKLYKRHKGSPFVGIYMFMKPAAVILDLELVKNILIKDFNYFHNRGVFHNKRDEPISNHIFAMEGAKWKALRSKLSPTFTSGKMKTTFPIVVDVAKRLEQKIAKIAATKDADVEMKNLMARFTIDVMGTVFFGIECNSLHDDNSEFHRMGMRVFADPKHTVLYDLFLLATRDWARRVGAKRFRDDVSDFSTRIVESTVNYREMNNVHRDDFMDILIGLKNSTADNKITFNELLAQCFVFFVAGFETSSSLLQFSLYELALNPEIQDKVRKHINDVLEKHNGKLTYEAIMDMKYLDQILNETLRLYSPVTTLFRDTDKDYKVPGTKFVFRKGTQIIIPAYAIQRDPEIFPNPDQFNPENCSEENMKKRPSVTFLPFGEGPRICIGARFGMMQARIAFIAALKNYKYTLSPRLEKPMKLDPSAFITSPKGGIWLNIEALEK